MLMIGDSFTYGDYVGNVRAINAGTAGTTIVTHTVLVERALPLRPDLAIWRILKTMSSICWPRCGTSLPKIAGGSPALRCSSYTQPYVTWRSGISLLRRGHVYRHVRDKALCRRHGA